jgi:hypothetical protein
LSREEDVRAFDEFDERPNDAPRRFTPDEMVACDACLRANAPTRMNCLYCGASLPVTEQSAALRRPALKRLEEWEEGFNVVMLSRAADVLTAEAIEEAASLLRLGAGRLSEMVGSNRALPVARASTAEEAELVVSRLRALKLVTEIFTDEELARSPARARSLDFEEDALDFEEGALVVFRTAPGAEPRRVPLSEVALLVKGRIVSRRIEVAESRKRFGGRSEMVETRELAADEAVLDLYTTSDDAGFRIMSGGFDYSCLGEKKGLLTTENFNALVSALRGMSPSALYDDEYERLRPLLADVWPPAEHTESLGLKRERHGRVNTEAVTTVSNEAQFTRYARLRRRLALRARAESS